MKEAIIPILIVVAIVAAIVLYNDKIKTQHDDIDKMKTALAGAKNIIKPGSGITLQNIPVKNEIHFWARYALSPNYLSVHTHQFDTVLTIVNVNTCDSIQNTLLTNSRKMLWQQKDEQYCYFLTCSK